MILQMYDIWSANHQNRGTMFTTRTLTDITKENYGWKPYTTKHSITEDQKLKIYTDGSYQMIQEQKNNWYKQIFHMIKTEELMPT